MRVQRIALTMRLLLLWHGMQLLQRLVLCAPSPAEDNNNNNNGSPTPAPRVIGAWEPADLGALDGGRDGYVDTSRWSGRRASGRGRRVGPFTGGHGRFTTSRESAEYLRGLKTYREQMEALRHDYVVKKYMHAHHIRPLTVYRQRDADRAILESLRAAGRDENSNPATTTATSHGNEGAAPSDNMVKKSPSTQQRARQNAKQQRQSSRRTAKQAPASKSRIEILSLRNPHDPLDAAAAAAADLDLNNMNERPAAAKTAQGGSGGGKVDLSPSPRFRWTPQQPPITPADALSDSILDAFRNADNGRKDRPRLQPQQKKPEIVSLLPPAPNADSTSPASTTTTTPGKEELSNASGGQAEGGGGGAQDTADRYAAKPAGADKVDSNDINNINAEADGADGDGAKRQRQVPRPIPRNQRGSLAAAVQRPKAAVPGDDSGSSSGSSNDGLSAPADESPFSAPLPSPPLPRVPPPTPRKRVVRPILRPGAAAAAAGENQGRHGQQQGDNGDAELARGGRGGEAEEDMGRRPSMFTAATMQARRMMTVSGSPQEMARQAARYVAEAASGVRGGPGAAGWTAPAGVGARKGVIRGRLR